MTKSTAGYLARELPPGWRWYDGFRAEARFWLQVQEMRPACVQDLESLTEDYGTLEDLESEGATRNHKRLQEDSQEAWNRLRANLQEWGRRWNILRTETPTNRPKHPWGLGVLTHHLELVLRDQDPGAPSQWEEETRDKVSDADPQKSEAARRRLTNFREDASLLLHGVFPLGLPDDVARALDALGSEGASVGWNPWVLKFEDAWDPEDGESWGVASRRIVDRFEIALEAYRDRLVGALLKGDSLISYFGREWLGSRLSKWHPGDIDEIFGQEGRRNIDYQKHPEIAFEWLVLRVVPEVANGVGLSVEAIDGLSGGEAGSIRDIRRRTNNLASWIGLRIPTRQRGRPPTRK